MVTEQEFVQEAFQLLDETIKQRYDVLDDLIKNGHLDIAVLMAIRSSANVFNVLDLVYKNRMTVEDAAEITLSAKDFRALHLYAYHLETLFFDIANTKRALRDLLQSVKEEKTEDNLAVDAGKL